MWNVKIVKNEKSYFWFDLIVFGADFKESSSLLNYV